MSTASYAFQRAGSRLVRPSIARRHGAAILVLFLGVTAVNLAYGAVMNAQGFQWDDASARVQGALAVLYGSDPHLAAIGFTWVPLPALLELPLVALYPFAPGVAASGFAATVVSSLAGGSAAAMVGFTASRLGLSVGAGVSIALLFALNPMVLLYTSNGMSEGVATPFLVGAVCLVGLYWHTSRRRYVAAAGLALGLGFASLYEGAPYALGVLAAVLAWLLGGRGRRSDAPRGRLNASFALGTLLLLPTAYVGIVWMIVNAAIQGDPLSFMTDSYSNAAQTERARAEGGVPWEVAGRVEATGAFVAARLWPFLIPVAAILVVRVVERRFATAETVGLLVAALSVPIGLIGPLIFFGQSFGWLRFFMYPLFVAVGWCVYEVASSRRRGLALGIVVSGWLLAMPATLVCMTHTDIGLQEHAQVARTVGRTPAEQGISSGLAPSFDPIARTVNRELDARSGGRVLVDGLAGWPLRLRIAPRHLKAVLSTEDRRFRRALRRPDEAGITHFLVPDPAIWEADSLVQQGFWEGRALGLSLVRRFPPTPTRREEWRLFAVAP